MIWYDSNCLFPPVCGDGNVDEGEDCEPPDTQGCDENC